MTEATGEKIQKAATPACFGLYVILTAPRQGYAACAAAAVAEEIRYVQLRMKNATRAEILAVGKSVRDITRGTQTRFMVNDDVTLAAELDADGVHLGQEDQAIEDARNYWKIPGRIYGLSTHNEQQARAAERLQPDYIGVGPVYATPTKARPDPVLGLPRMGGIIRATPLATVAIGGITPENLPQVLAHGAVNFCAVRAIMQAGDPRAIIRQFQQLWRETLARRDSGNG